MLLKTLLLFSDNGRSVQNADLMIYVKSMLHARLVAQKEGASRSYMHTYALHLLCLNVYLYMCLVHGCQPARQRTHTDATQLAYSYTGLRMHSRGESLRA